MKLNGSVRARPFTVVYSLPLIRLKVPPLVWQGSQQGVYIVHSRVSE